MNNIELPYCLTVPEVAQHLRIGTNSVYRLLRSGKLQSVRIGRQYRIPRQMMLEYLESVKHKK